jgi:hypothetical protein
MNDDGPSRAARETRESFDKTMEAGAETTRRVQEGFTSAVENVCDLNVRLIDMARANTDVAFQFARQVAAAKKPSDFLEAWTAHATKTFDMLTKQASELTTLGQRIANKAAEPVTRTASKPE